MEASELLKYKNWVVAGDVLSPQKYAHRILEELKDNGFNAEGLNPRDNSGKVAKELEDIKYKAEVLDLCINPIQGLRIVQEAARLGVDKILIQPGAESKEILSFCRENSIIAIEGCALVELSRYNP